MNGTEKSTPSSSSSPSPVITLPTAFEFEPAFEPAFEDPAGGSLPPFTCPKQYPSGPSTPPSAAASVFSTSFMKDRNAKGFGHTRTRTEGSCTRRGGDDEEEAATADDDAALSSPFARASDFFARDASSSESESESNAPPPPPAPGLFPGRPRPRRALGPTRRRISGAGLGSSPPGRRSFPPRSSRGPASAGSARRASRGSRRSPCS